MVCEKPLAVNSRESAELVRLVQETGLVAAVNYNLPFIPRATRLARVLAGEIGQVRIIHDDYLQDWLFHSGDWNWRLDPALGGPFAPWPTSAPTGWTW